MSEQELIGKIVDEVFDGAIEDPQIIIDILACAARHTCSAGQHGEAVAYRAKTIDGGYSYLTANEFEKNKYSIALWEALYAQPPASDVPTDDQIKYMVNRFLSWKLPENFSPDDGISFKKTFNEHTAHPMKHEPSGTNLFDATQADAMVRYMIDGMPGETTRSAGQPAEVAPVAWMRGIYQPSTPNGPEEYDAEAYVGEDAPEGKGWTPLFAQPPASAMREVCDALQAMIDAEVDYMTINKLGDPEKQHNIIRARKALAAAPDAGWQAIDERLIISGTKLRKSRTQSSWDLEIETSLTAEQNVACTIIQDNFYQAFSGRGKTISEAVIKCLNDADAWLSSPEGQPLAALTQQEPTP